MSNRRYNFTSTNQPKNRASAPGSVTSKSKVTNGKWVLAGVDMRTPAGRRFRDLCNGFEKEAGGNLTETERSLVRQAAAVTLRAEAMQSALVRGARGVRFDDVIRLSSEARRLLAPINAAGRRKAAPHSLDAYPAREVTP
jgi:hypothetical protein